MWGKCRLSVVVGALILMLSVSGLAFAGTVTNWDFVYENDAQGQAVSGSWSALADAIEKGATVKVVFNYPTSTTFKSSVVANSALVDRSRNICYAQWNGNSMGDDNGDGIVTLRDNYIEYQLLRTDGNKEYLLRTSTGTVYSHGYENVVMKWYVNK